MTPELFYNIIAQETLRDTIADLRSPCFVVFEKMILKRLADLRQVLDGRAELSFAVKSNPSLALLRFMARQGVGADIASKGELERVLEAGFSPANIHIAGPGKSDEELVAAVEANVGAVYLESLQELARLEGICERLGRRANVGVRLNPTMELPNMMLQMQGKTAFGLQENDCRTAVARVNKRGDIFKFVGLHSHVASQVLEPDAVVAAASHLMEFAFSLVEQTGIAMPSLNFGGGWGIDYHMRQKPLDLQKLRVALASLFTGDTASKLRQGGSTFRFEPGRMLVGEAGVYVSRVLVTKDVQDAHLAVLDGGMHHCYMLSGGMGQILRRDFYATTFAADGRSGEDGREYLITGKLCTPQDVLQRSLATDHELVPGDQVVFFNCGAYGSSASPLGFLSHGAPDEHLIGADAG